MGRFDKTTSKAKDNVIIKANDDTDIPVTIEVTEMSRMGFKEHEDVIKQLLGDSVNFDEWIKLLKITKSRIYYSDTLEDAVPDLASDDVGLNALTILMNKWMEVFVQANPLFSRLIRNQAEQIEKLMNTNGTSSTSDSSSDKDTTSETSTTTPSQDS